MHAELQQHAAETSPVNAPRAAACSSGRTRWMRRAAAARTDRGERGERRAERDVDRLRPRDLAAAAAVQRAPRPRPPSCSSSSCPRRAAGAPVPRDSTSTPGSCCPRSARARRRRRWRCGSTRSARPDFLTRRRRVAAADDGEARRRGHGPATASVPAANGSSLEQAHRAVPEDRPRAERSPARSGVAVAGRCRAPSSRRARRRRPVRARRHRPRSCSPTTRSDRERARAGPSSARVEQPGAPARACRPRQRVAHLMALGGEEGVSHARRRSGRRRHFRGSRSITPILSETLAPPSTATNGLLRDRPAACASASISRCEQATGGRGRSSGPRPPC